MTHHAKTRRHYRVQGLLCACVLSLAAGAALADGRTGVRAASDNEGSGQNSLGSVSIASSGVLYMGGTYDNPAAPTTLTGQMYVLYAIPGGDGGHGSRHKYPIIMVHGAGQTGANFLGTPDGRPGWADYFVSQGWPVYVVDQVGRGKSGYFPNVYGPQGPTAVPTTVERQFTAPETFNPLPWPQAALHTQWPGGPGSGVVGEYAFDQFFASQVAQMPDIVQQDDLTTKAITALLQRIGPSILITHSQAGPLSWMVPQSAPGLVKAVIAVEPGAAAGLTATTAPAAACGLSPACMTYVPPVNSPADLNLVSVPPIDAEHQNCWLQNGPVIHKLVWPTNLPVLVATGEASYHATYDNCTDQELSQAGVPHVWVRLAELGFHGNGHMQMLEMNNLDLARFYESWLKRNLR